MRTKVGHLVYGVHPENLAFYREMFTFLGWAVLYEGEGMLGLGASDDTSIWFGAATAEVANHYDGPGLNHLALQSETVGEVDEAAAWLGERGIEMRFDTPRHRPDFSGEGSTYYQIMFESPDRLLFEIVYIGPY